MTNYDEYLRKIALLKAMAHHYYTLDAPIASDDEYDALYVEIAAFEAQNPDKIAPDSPTQKVGDKISAEFKKSTHIERMWSLEDIFNNDELKAWMERIYRLLRDSSDSMESSAESRGDSSDFSVESCDSNMESRAKSVRFMCDAKFDGASLNLLYENGNLVSAATRGDGSVGEQVLGNARMIPSIPQTIAHKGKIEIRGEVVIAKSDFEALNESRLQRGESIFANPRNAAAGSLRNLDASVTRSRKLTFIPWGFGFWDENRENPANDSFFARLNTIKSLGFIDTKLSAICADIGEIEAFYQHLVALRENYHIMLDGMVIRIDSVAAQNALGYTIKNPRFAVAYKFPAIEKTTKIRDITFQVGRTGVITPVAELEPVMIEGAKITRATLHNFDEIAKKDIRVGDFVLIIRSGDVIPKIIKPILERRIGSEIAVKKPQNCPVCGSELLIEDILIKCQNLNCKARVINAIIHFCSKKAMNIVGLGEKIVEFLFENGLIRNILDIYALKNADLQGKEGFGEKKIANLLDSIEKSKNAPLHSFINALGIEHIGEGASKKLATAFGERIFHATREELLEIDGIGPEMADSITLFMQTNARLLADLRAIINPILPSQNAAESSGSLSGEIIVLTGTMSKPREQIASELEALGAKITNSISSKTTMLVCGQNAGSKVKKAHALGVKIIDEAELWAQLDLW